MAAVGAYPRVCGATRMTSFGTGPVAGLSPRVRGNPMLSMLMAQRPGPIPACAGQPKLRGCDGHAITAYPHVCGATCSMRINPAGAEGLSPRVRGNLAASHEPARQYGPIPACAGQPRAASCSLYASRAYPRVCGATCTLSAQVTPSQGLSPRVRGNRRGDLAYLRTWGPIPACAGQPPLPRLSPGRGWAYPRVCGAT